MSEFSEAVRQAISYSLAGVHTALPGRIESYNAAKRMASVKPLVKRVYADGKVESLPVIAGVPVQFPRSGSGLIKFRLKKGDGCLLVFCERAIERWKLNGGEQEPGKNRRHDLTDAVAIPGLGPFTEPDSTAEADALFAAGAAALKFDAGKIALGASGVELLDIVSQLMNLVATANCINGAPLTTAAAIAALKIQLDGIKGTL